MPDSSLGPQEYPHRPTHVFPAHFVLTHAHPGRTFRSVTHHSKPSMLNFGVFWDELPKKKLQLVGMSILINPIKPWAEMSYGWHAIPPVTGAPVIAPWWQLWRLWRLGCMDRWTHGSKCFLPCPFDQTDIEPTLLVHPICACAIVDV
jgi:hypothetical protein